MKNQTEPTDVKPKKAWHKPVIREMDTEQLESGGAPTNDEGTSPGPTYSPS